MQVEYVLLITLGAMLIVNPLLSSGCRRLGIPSLVGYIGLGFVVRILEEEWRFSSPDFETTFSMLAEMGVVALLFRVGLKSHTSALLAKLPDASMLWVGDVLTNLVVGYLVARYGLSLSVESSMVIATAFSATSVGVSVAVWEELGRLQTDTGQLLLDVAELDDLSGVLLLAIVLAIIPVLHDGSNGLLLEVGSTTLGVLVKLVAFITVCYLFAHFLESRFTRVSARIGGSPLALTICILGAGLTIAALAGYLGFSLAIGALFAGLAFSRDPDAVRTDGNFAHFYELLTPFFFIHIGMQMEPEAFFGSIGMGLALFVAAAFAKFAGVGGPALLRMDRPSAVTLGISMIPRAEIALVVLNQSRLVAPTVVTPTIFSAMIIVTLVSSIVAPIVLRRRLQERVPAA
jgi:Kef-type K+ transport system membrane component KefB